MGKRYKLFFFAGLLRPPLSHHRLVRKQLRGGLFYYYYFYLFTANRMVFFYTQTSFYVAEFWNTVSNVWIILPPVLGMVEAWRHGHENR